MTRGSMGGRGPTRAFLLVLTVLLLGSLWTVPGRAQASATDKAAAEALFDEGVGLLQAGKYEAACKKLEDSERIDSGIGTLLYLADCYEKLGKTASAWATFRAAASQAQNAGQADRARAGNERAKRLEPKLVRLTIDAVPETKNLDGLKIRRGTEGVPLTLLAMAVPVDPGVYEVVASAPGYLPYRTTITVEAALPSQSILVPALELDPSAPDPATATATAATQPTPSEADKEQAAPRGRTQRTVGLVLGGVGLLGLGVGSVFGLVAMDENKRAEEAGCVGSTCSTDEAAALGNAAYDHATLSTVFFIAGGALLATGAVVYFTAPRERKEAVSLTRLGVAGLPGGLAFSLGGTF